MSEDSFVGWSLEDWSLQHQLLELRFNLWLVFKKESDIELYNQTNKDAYYRGKGIFTRPTRMTFSNFTSRAKVEEIAVSKLNDDIVTYRFSLEKGAFVEIEARAYVSARW